MLRQIALILVLVALSQADVWGRRRLQWDNVNERGLYPSRYQERGENTIERNLYPQQNSKRGHCAFDFDCSSGENCLMFICVKL